MRHSNLNILLNDTYESYYWLGFLMADGYFSKNRIQITIHKQDQKHLRKLKRYVGDYSSIKQRKYISAAWMDSDLVPKLKTKFKISNRKTYEPCDLSSILDTKLFFCLIVGFIDGDGSISKQSGRDDVFLRIKCHPNWINNLRLFANTLETLNLSSKIVVTTTSHGWGELRIANNTDLRTIKKLVIELNLPILTRKWDKINLDKISRRELKLQNKHAITRLLNQGYDAQQILKITKLSEYKVYQYIKEIKNDNISS